MSAPTKGGRRDERSGDEGDAPRPLPPAGLCAGCRHRRQLASRRSTFLACARAATDPTYPRYPRLPVLACPGYEAGDDEASGEEGSSRVE